MKSTVLLIFLISVVLLVVTVLMGWVLNAAYTEIEEVSVSVEYNIAGIIAALLGGSGISLAGISYAKSKFADHS